MQSFLPDNPGREPNAAALAPLTIALFTFGEFLMGVPWAKVSDRIGRKPTLIIGTVGGGVSALAFGLSTNLWMALAARIFGGLVNPNVGVISACVGELIESKQDQGKAFSVVPFLRGPVIGGYLADPVISFPSVFHDGSIWQTYPYLLPNLIVFLFIAISGLLGFFFLEETHPRLQSCHDRGLNISRWVSNKLRQLVGQMNASGYATILTNDDEMAEDATELENLPEEIGLSSSPSPTVSNTRIPSPYSSQVILQILAVSIFAFHKVSSDVIIPMFLGATTLSPNNSSEETKGNFLKFEIGFGMNPPRISNVLLSQAVVAIVAQSLIVPRVLTNWGALKSFQWVALFFPWKYCLTPFTARLVSPLSLIAIVLDLWISIILANIGYVASAILLTNTTPSRQLLATVNRAAASLSCLARSIGAATSGYIFRQGLQDGYIGLPFWILGSVAAAGTALSWFLRDEP
ncbi:Major facilitator superfamily domain containing protein [Elaphomyces granulatus]